MVTILLQITERKIIYSSAELTIYTLGQRRIKQPCMNLGAVLQFYLLI